MKLILCLTIMMIMILSACASRSEQLAKEYEIISRKSDGMQNELKATVNAQNAVEDCLKAQAEAESRLDKIMQIREDNEDNDIPIGLSIDRNAEPQELINQLRMNFDHLSAQLDELKKEKGRVTKEQMNED